MEKYELVEGHAIIDENYCVITANEQFYRFLGNTTSAISLIESIHQVDAEDFMDVCQRLKEDKTVDMVLRIRRADNSYRWILIQITKFTFQSELNTFEYLELNASDIFALKRQNEILQNNVMNFRHILAMENEMFFVYDYNAHTFQINNFIDNEIHNFLDMNINALNDKIDREHLIDESTLDEYNAFCNDMKHGILSYSHTFKTSLLTNTDRFDKMELHVNTIYKDDRPDKAVGSIHNLSDNAAYKSLHTYNQKQRYTDFTSSDIYQFCTNNIKYKLNCEFTLILLKVNNYDKIEEEKGACYIEALFKTVVRTVRQLVGYRGIVCDMEKNLLCIAIREINNEVNLRAFLESLRNQILWNVLLAHSNKNITFSIGISRYPQNGSDIDIVYKKLYRALEICSERSNNRYIIYREHLYGELK